MSTPDHPFHQCHLAPSSRLSTKRALHDQLQLHTLLPHFHVKLLVISTDQSHSDQQARVRIDFNRLNRTHGQWYYISMFSNSSNTSKEFGVLAHDSIALYNRRVQQQNPTTSCQWTIPLFLCRPWDSLKGSINAPIVFDAYQTDPELHRVTIKREEVISAFNSRLFLFRWLNCTESLRLRRPLSPEHIKFATRVDVSDRVNITDLISYQLLAHGLTRHTDPMVMDALIEGEVRLLRFRLLLRPELWKLIRGAESMEEAVSFHALYTLHRANIMSIIKRTDPYFDSPLFVQQSDMFLTELKRMTMESQMDGSNDVSWASRSAPHDFSVHSSEPIPIEDIRGCAPACMRRCMEKAIGRLTRVESNDQHASQQSQRQVAQNEPLSSYHADLIHQQASLPSHHRRHLIHFLLEHRYDKSDIMSLLRPRRMIEYEMDQPRMIWADIDRMIGRVQRDRALFEEEKQQEYVPCAQVIDSGVCPWYNEIDMSSCSATLTTTTATGADGAAVCRLDDSMSSTQSDSAQVQSSPLDNSKQRAQADRRARYVLAKKRCHSEMRDTWSSRYQHKNSGGRSVTDAWTMSPFRHTSVAYRGERANIENEEKKKNKTKSDTH